MPARTTLADFITYPTFPEFDLDPVHKNPLGAVDSGPSIRVFVASTLMTLLSTFMRRNATFLVSKPLLDTRSCRVISPHPEPCHLRGDCGDGAPAPNVPALL